jgi:hypothetical protein
MEGVFRMVKKQREGSDIRDALSRVQPLPDSQTARPPEARAAVPTRGDAGGMLRGALQGGPPREADGPLIIAVGNVAISRVIADRWLTADYLGADIRADFERHRPQIGTRPPAFFASYRYGNITPSGISLWDSDSIFVSSHITLEADRWELIAHESLHQAAEIGGGLDMRWPDDGGRLIPRGEVRWLHEGMTELHAQQLAREHGYQPSSVSYPYETVTAFYIQRAVVTAAGDERTGREVVRRAYLTGDYTQVRVMVEMALGPGSFDQIMQAGGRGSDALAAFESVRERAGRAFLGGSLQSSFLEWSQAPLVRQAMDSANMRRLLGLSSSPDSASRD